MDDKKLENQKRGRRINKRGKDNEREFAKKLETKLQSLFGKDTYRVRRTPMSGGMHLDFPADIFFPKAPRFSVMKELHIDCKVAENWHPKRWYDEEKELCRKTGTPFQKVVIVARKPGESQQLAIINWDDLERLLMEIEGFRNEENGN